MVFISNTFISNARLKLAKNQAKAKQHAGAKLLLYENYWLSSTTLSCKTNQEDILSNVRKISTYLFK